MAFDENQGTAKLAQVLSDRMQSHQRRNNKVTVDYGTVDSEYNLTTNNFTKKIPPSDYMVCRHLTELKIEMNCANCGTHSYKSNYLKPGDRVLVVLIGNEFCVVDVIRPADELQKGEKL